MVILITGLSGAGKTTLATALYEAMKPALPTLVRIDGGGSGLSPLGQPHESSPDLCGL
jgi:adenylylsulfate kinase-like enzyme